MSFDFHSRVLIDARKLFDGGIGRYTRNLIEGLLRFTHAFVGLIGDEDTIGAFLEDLARDACVPGVSEGPSPFAKRVVVIPGEALQYSIDEQYFFSKRVPWEGFDLYHVPHYPLPRGVPIPSVLTVHDLIHLTHPEKPYYPFVASTLLKRSLRNASAVLTVSKSVGEELRSFVKGRFGIVEKLRVVPNSLPNALVHATTETPTSSSKSDVPYLLVVISQLKPHKGFESLLSAMEAVAAHDSNMQLRVVGQGCTALVDSPALLGRSMDLKSVRLLGEVSDEELFSLYKKASAVVVPSMVEGFGLPVLEAHAFGVPVVMRPVPALRELALSLDLCAEDFTVESLTQAILRAAKRDNSKAQVSDFRDECSRQVESFSLRSATYSLLECYYSILRSHAKRSVGGSAFDLEMR